jgi:hypothetical protein
VAGGHEAMNSDLLRLSDSSFSSCSEPYNHVLETPPCALFLKFLFVLGEPSLVDSFRVEYEFCLGPLGICRFLPYWTA